jgi:hypothetical protein
MKYIKAYILFTALAVGVGLVLYFFNPAIEDVISDEYSFVQTSTALMYLVASGVALYLMRQSRSRTEWIVLAVAGLVGFLEETSFGHVYIDYPIMVIDGKPIDALHDFFGLAGKLVYQGIKAPQTRMITLVIVAAGAAGGTALLGLYWQKWLASLKYIFQHPVYLLIGLFFTWNFISLVLDTHILPFSTTVIEEMLEWSASVGLLFANYVGKKIDLPAGD